MTHINCGCDEKRRDFLKKVGKSGLALGFMGLSMQSDIFVQRAFGEVPRKNALYDCALQIFFSGGPSQTDTWDPKPGENVNQFNTINLGVNDKYGNPIQISEVFPNLANLVMNDANVGLGLLRSMSHGSNSHGNGQQYMNCFWKGTTFADMYPSTAAVMAYYFQGSGLGIPAVVINGSNGRQVNDAKQSRCPTALQVNAGSGQGSNRVVQALGLPPGVDAQRYARRQNLLTKLNARFLSQRPDQLAKDFDKATRDAIDIAAKGDAARAFDLTGTPLVPGANNGVRQRLTQAAKLLTAGIPYVACGIGGNDSHSNNMRTIRRNWGQEVDQGVVEVINRIKNSGKRCLILMGGEFGRTPEGKVPRGVDGRDHWGDGFSWAMVSVNQPLFKTGAWGDTGPRGTFRVRDNNLVDPVEPKDLGALLYRSMGFQVGLEVAYDVPLNARDAPPVDRMNNGTALMKYFGLTA
ncbi:MAG: DUF1501 domain-containing protein [Planctomycetota bacterium]|nr:MAG: DUF1501 domain-containing protein [Planctomycetota bacterium]